MSKNELPPAPAPNILFQINTTPTAPVLPASKDREHIDIRYPLLEPYAYAHIYWDRQANELVYFIEEPELNEAELDLLETVERGIEELINISFLNVKTAEAVIEYLEKNIKVLLAELGIKVTQETFLKIMYYVYRDFVGLNEIEPLLKDYFIEDIECNGINTPLYIVHRKYRNLRTNIIFPSMDHLTSFVEKLAQKCGKYISYASPILDAQLPDKSRINATFTQEISSRGPTFSIRKFTTEPWSPVKLIQFRTLSPEMLAYLWILIEHEANFVIIGGTGSGKTSLLNALASFIPPAARIVSIEDTREINLVHENWLPSVTREAIGIGGEGKFGEIDLFTLLRASFRQRPDYVIVGEIRGAEASVLFQGAASIKGEEKILVLNDNHLKRIPIKDLKESVRYKVITIDPETEKSKIVPIKLLHNHGKRKELYNIITKSGRSVTVTSDHSVFTYKSSLLPVAVSEVRENDIIIVPGKIPCGYADFDYLDLIEYLPDIRVYAPKYVREAVKMVGYDHACNVVERKAISDYYANFSAHKPAALHADKFFRLMKEANIEVDLNKIDVRYIYNSKPHHPRLKITKEFLRLLGYYLSEGSLDDTTSKNPRSGGNSTINIYNSNDVVLNDMRKCIKAVTGSNIRERITHGFGEAVELSFTHKVIFEFIKRYCKKVKEKTVPDFIFGLSKEKIGEFLSALYCGDGSVRKEYVGYYTTSRNLANDVSQLLLVYGIVPTIKKRRREGRNCDDYELKFYSFKDKSEFLRYVRPINKTIKMALRKDSDHNRLKNDLYLDVVKEVEKVKLQKPELVYDISVPGYQNFIGGFGGVLLHNSGHPSACTMHAEDVETMIKRLETPPISLSPGLVETIDIVCIISQAKVKGEDVRRVKSIVEIIEVNENGDATTNSPFIWDPASDAFFFKTESVMFRKLVSEYGLNMNTLLGEFSARTRLLFELYRRNIVEYKQVQDVINAYYTSPEEVLKRFNII